MAANTRPRTSWSRELRPYLALACGVVGAGLAVASAWLLWHLLGDAVVAYWSAIPLQMRLAFQLSLVAAVLAIALVAGARAWRTWRGRQRAFARAKETPPIVEFAAGSVTAAALTEGESLELQTRAFLDANRRKYLIRPKDAMPRPKREWGEPVLFAEPTRAGDTRLQPVLTLAQSERPKHQKNLQTLLANSGQVTTLRVIIGVGKGYTSLTRAHALRDDLARVQAKFRMNCIITDAPSPTASVVPDDPAAPSGQGVVA